jgi:type II secretory pathway pseudopilin PulG
MRRALRSAKSQIPNRKSQSAQRGYMMITLMLALAMMTFALAVVLPDISQQIRRDREEEMMHRGTAYMRAIQHYYRKLGRYPMKIEDLENTNNVRFLRKRYTDPLNVDPATGKERDFKLLHQQDISLNNGPVLGQPNGQQGAPGGQSGLAAVLGGQSGFGGSQFGGSQGGLGGLNSPADASQSAAAQNSGSPNSSSQNPASGDSGNSSGTASSGAGSSGDSGANSASPGSSSSSSSSGPNGQTFGGGPILGVGSQSKAKTIRVFFDKNHYNDWYFVYIPQADIGGLLKGPINPGLPTGISGSLTPQGAGGTAAQGASGAIGSGLGSTSNGAQSQPTPTPAPTTPQQ